MRSVTGKLPASPVSEALQMYGRTHAIGRARSRVWLARSQPMEISSADVEVRGAVEGGRRGPQPRSTRRRSREAAEPVRNRSAASGEKLARRCRRCRTRNVRYVKKFRDGGQAPRHFPWTPCPWSPPPWSPRVKAGHASARRREARPSRARSRTGGRLPA